MSKALEDVPSSREVLNWLNNRVMSWINVEGKFPRFVIAHRYLVTKRKSFSSAMLGSGASDEWRRKIFTQLPSGSGTAPEGQEHLSVARLHALTARHEEPRLRKDPGTNGILRCGRFSHQGDVGMPHYQHLV